MASKNPQKSTFLVLLCLVGILASIFVLGMIKKSTQPCANSISCIKDLTGEYVPNKESTFQGRIISPPSYIAQNPVPERVLGSSSGNKHIFVDLATQTLRAYEGNKVVFSFLISSGKWGKTPTGDFRIWIKLRNAHMEGGSGADYYNLYNVPYTMFFYNNEVSKERGFSLHGAYWHNNFGYIMSHGCVNIRPEDAEKLYYWADPSSSGNLTYATKEDPGTMVTITGTPQNY